MSLFRYVFTLVFRNVARFVPPEFRGKLEDLFAQALDALLVSCRGSMLWKHSGNPSGWFLTLFLNTMALYMLIGYAYLGVYPDASRREFEHYVKCLLCGDDSLVSMHEFIRMDFTAEHIISTWKTLLVTVKTFHGSMNPHDIEYCGAFSLTVAGKYVRKPRVTKFLSALAYTRTDDPLIRLQRAASIWYELWPCPDDAQIVKGFIEHLFARYPYLEKHRRDLLTQSEQMGLHLGLE